MSPKQNSTSDNHYLQTKTQNNIISIFCLIVGQLEENLKLSDTEFTAKFGRAKPADEAVVIFHCKMGGRAGKAAQVAMELGFVK